MAKITTQKTTGVGEVLKRGKPSFTVGGNANWCTLLWRILRKFLKKLQIELSFDPAIELLDIYPKYTKIQIERRTCTPMVIAALSTIAKLWRRPKCPLTDE